MPHIVAARFETAEDATGTLALLQQAGFDRAGLAQLEVGRSERPARERTGLPAWGAGALVLGLGMLLGAALGWLGVNRLPATLAPSPLLIVLAFGALGAYLAARVVLRQRRTARRGTAARRSAGVLVAARADDPAAIDRACSVFVARDALEIEEAEGEIRDGRWTDFDGGAPPRIVARKRPGAIDPHVAADAHTAPDTRGGPFRLLVRTDANASLAGGPRSGEGRP